MNYQVITEPRAEADIHEAFRWIAEDSPKNALRWQQGLEAAIDSLETFPERCSLAPENEVFHYEIRQLLCGNYRILFTIQARVVHILHARHGARRHLTLQRKVMPTGPTSNAANTTNADQNVAPPLQARDTPRKRPCDS